MVSFTLKVARGVSCTILTGIYAGTRVCPTQRVSVILIFLAYSTRTVRRLIGCGNGDCAALEWYLYDGHMKMINTMGVQCASREVRPRSAVNGSWLFFRRRPAPLTRQEKPDR